MNFLLNEELALKIKQNKVSPAILGNTNNFQIVNGANGQIFEITNNIGSMFYGIAYTLTFPSGFGSCIVEIFNTQENKRILSGLNTLNSVGVLNTVKNSSNFTPIVPIRIASGQFVQVSLNNNSGNSIPVFGISMSLYGFFE